MGSRHLTARPVHRPGDEPATGQGARVSRGDAGDVLRLRPCHRLHGTHRDVGPGGSALRRALGPSDSAVLRASAFGF